MVWAMDSQTLSDHLTNDAMPTAYMMVGAVNGVPAATRWVHGEATVKQAIAALVPDSVFNCVEMQHSRHPRLGKQKYSYIM
jgi:hypothetical protein